MSGKLKNSKGVFKGGIVLGKQFLLLSLLVAGSSVGIAENAAESASGGDSNDPAKIHVGTTDSKSDELGEVVVTANRREENVQKVPISVAVISGQELATAGIVTADSLEVLTPNISTTNLNGVPLFYIRGMGSANVTPGAEGPVGLYMDGVFVPYARSLDQDLLDIQRVEVLKGPQGTLYGRNTTGGAINFITRDPSAEQTAELTTTIGSWGTERIQGFASSGPGPLAASIAVISDRHDAYMQNLSNGLPQNDLEEKGLRTKIKFAPDDTLSIVLEGAYMYKHDLDGTGFLQIFPTTATTGPSAANPANPGIYSTLANPRQTYSDVLQQDSQYKDASASLNIRKVLSFADVVSISGFENLRELLTADEDGSTIAGEFTPANSTLRNWSQEFQLVSNTHNQFDWIVGLYAFNSIGGFDPVGIYGPGNTAPRVNPPYRFSTTGADEVVSGIGSSRAYAAYAQADYKLTDGLKFTVGVRESRETRYLDSLQVATEQLGVIFNQTPDHKTWDAFTPKLGIDYSWGDQLLYASFTKGFRSGSYNITSPGAIGPVNPEYVKSYELGGKHTLVDGLRFNWAVFKANYNDLQVSTEQNNGGASLFLNENAANAVSKGAEAELSYSGIKKLTIDLGVGYLDAVYTSFPNAVAIEAIPGGGYGTMQTSVNASGRPLAQAPKWTSSLRATYNMPIGSNSIDVSGTYYYTAKYLLDSASNIGQAGFGIANLTAMYNFPGNHVRIGAFVTNLFNKVYLEGESTNAFGIIAQPNPPRIAGATIALRY